MYKPNTKKMLTVLIAAAMIFSAFAILSFAATPAYAASGTFTSNPTTFAVGTGTSGTPPYRDTIGFVSGGTFGSGSTVYFFLSTTTASSGAVAGSGGISVSGGPTPYAIGEVTLAAGTTTLSNQVTFEMASGAVAGSYYILAEDFISGSPSGTFALGPLITIVPYIPTVSIASSVTVGSSQEVTGLAFDAGASVTLYLNYPGSTTLGTTTASSSGAIDTYITIPALSQGSYSIVAQETNTLSASFPEGGITADASFTVAPAITITPVSTSGVAGSAFTITGSGFAAGDSVVASTTSAVTSSITIGGQNTYHSAITVASDGSFTTSVTLATAITGSKTVGPVSVIITGLSTPAQTFSDAVYVSSPSPSALGFQFTVTPITGVYNVGDSVTAAVWNFPAGTTVSIMLGSVLVGTVTTDSNGYGALPSTTTVPAMPASTVGTSYNAYARTSSGMVATAPAVTLTSDYQVTDPANNMMTSSEYFPSTGHYIVAAFGLDPTATYSWADTAAGAAASVVSVTVGSYSSSTGDFAPAANGTLNFSYAPAFTTPATAATATFTLEDTVSSADVAAYPGVTFGYTTITLVSVTAPGYLSNSGAGTAGLTFTQSGFIPASATLYPGNTSEYNVYIGSTELTIGGVTAITTATLGSSDTYTNPTLPSGVYNLSVVYNGQPVSNAIFTEPIIISAAGSSVSSGGVSLVPNAAGNTLLLVGYGFDSFDSLSGGYMTSSGYTAWAGLALSHGAFVSSNGPSYPLNDIAGTYYAYVTASLAGSSNTVSTSYTVTASLTITSPLTSSGPIGTAITGTATGLGSDAYYDVYLGSNYITTVESSVTGSFTGTLVSAADFPLVPAGNYTLSLDPSGTTTATVSAPFQVVTNPNLVLSADPQQAFPTELVQFSATLAAPATPATGVLTGSYALISLNGTLVEKVPATYASGVLSGSFQMINGNPGSYFLLSVTGLNQYTIGASPGTGTVYVPYASSVSDYFALVSGAGALITGFNTAQLTAIIQTAIGNAMKVPLSELNASVIAINNATAQIKTAFGTMTSTLTAINATVAGIQSGQVLVQTDLGSIMTSFASLNASIATFNGDVVYLNTTLGQVQTSLSSIGTQVTTNGNGIATITTDLGTLSGTVTSTSNGVSTIQTSLGDLNATVQTIKNQTSGFPTLEIFLIVIIVLVLITLVISFLAVSAANKAARRATEEKKQ